MKAGHSGRPPRAMKAPRRSARSANPRGIAPRGNQKKNEQGPVMAVAPASHPPFHKSLYFKVLLAILIGVVLGVLSPSNVKVVPEPLRGFILLPLGWAESMKPFGDGFIKMIKMLIAPIIFCTVVHGI